MADKHRQMKNLIKGSRFETLDIKTINKIAMYGPKLNTMNVAMRKAK
jgi:hypothetical protein